MAWASPSRVRRTSCVLDESGAWQARGLVEERALTSSNGTHGYSEELLVEIPAFELFAETWWETLSALEEVFGSG